MKIKLTAKDIPWVERGIIKHKWTEARWCAKVVKEYKHSINNGLLVKLKLRNTVTFKQAVGIAEQDKKGYFPSRFDARIAGASTRFERSLIILNNLKLGREVIITEAEYDNLT